VLGIVAPLGANLERVETELEHALREVNYSVERIHLARVLTDRFEPTEKIDAGFTSNVANQYAAKMAIGTQFCRQTARKDAMAMLSIDEIRRTRAGLWSGQELSPQAQPALERPRTAYVIHQLKRPEEVNRLRQVYEGRFRLIAVWESRDDRVERLARRLAKDAESSDIPNFRPDAESLVDRDDRELAWSEVGTQADKFGQNVRDTFPLADVFVSPSVGGEHGANPPDLGLQIRRFVHALFGAPDITPSRDEFGMHLATTAAWRSGSLARQVGAAICTSGGDTISVGTNEVPKPFGGMYWQGDVPDDRDVARGHDASDLHRHSMVGDVLERLKKAGWLNREKARWSRERLVSAALDQKQNVLRSARLMDVLEFVRALHAEQAAIVEAAYKGISTASATLYVTTFPCHECARMILAAGIGRLVYIEPYMKSRALEQYPLGITTDPTPTNARVRFMPFIGIAPRFFRSVFEWTESRKTEDGTISPWDPMRAVPRAASLYPGHIVAEQLEAAEFVEHLAVAGLASSTTPNPVVARQTNRKRGARDGKSQAGTGR
jgi:cytidine deaminase